MLGLAVFTVWQAIQVRVALNDVAIRMTKTVDELAQGNVEQAESNSELARDSAAEALAYTRGPIWWSASKLPWIGDDVTAVRTVSEVVEQLTNNTIPDLVEAGGTFGPETLRPEAGRIDLAPLPEVAPVLRAGAEELDAGRDRVASLETAGLLEELRGPVVELQDKLRKAAGAASSAAIAAELMPDMLGGGEPRTYLAVFQNNAEIRSQGGLFGAMAILRAHNGKVEMIEQGRPADLGTFSPTFIDLTPQERSLHSTRLSIYAQNATSMPDFPRSAEILSQMWEARHTSEIDGVVSIDPVAMGYLMRGTGPLRVGDDLTIDSTNAAAILMRDVYRMFPTNEAQNAFFDLVARKLFQQVLGGPQDTQAMLDGIVQATSERRLMLWSSHADEQRRLSGTSIAGELTPPPGPRPDVGVFLNDAAADKLSYYLDYEVDVRPRSCGSEGNQILDVSLAMKSTVPPGADLPPYVLGPQTNPTAPGVMINTVYLYAPVGGRVDEASGASGDVPMDIASYKGREVGLLTVALEPGEEQVIDFVLITGRDQTGDPRLTTTPAAQGTGHGFVGDSAC